jgi:hypothetical protein
MVKQPYDAAARPGLLGTPGLVMLSFGRARDTR